MGPQQGNLRVPRLPKQDAHLAGLCAIRVQAALPRADEHADRTEDDDMTWVAHGRSCGQTCSLASLSARRKRGRLPAAPSPSTSLSAAQPALSGVLGEGTHVPLTRL